MKDTERLSVNSVLKCNHGQILKTHLHLWGSLLISHAQPLPHPTPQTTMNPVYPEFFPSFNFVQDGERGDCKIFLKSWPVICCCCCCKNTQKLQKVRTTASLSQGLLSRIIVISKLSPLKKWVFIKKKRFLAVLRRFSVFQLMSFSPSYPLDQWPHLYAEIIAPRQIPRHQFYC